MRHPPSVTVSRRGLLRAGGAAAALALAPACAPSGSGPRTVAWQAIPPYSLQAPDPRRAAYLERRLAAHRGRSPYGVDPLVSSNDTSAAMAKLLLQASQGRAPDIAQVDSYIFGRVARYARPIGPHLKRLGLETADWFPTMRREMEPRPGDVRGLQFTSDVRVLYYRRDLVKSPPADWEEMTRSAKSLARRGYSVLYPAGRSEGAVTTTLWPAYWSRGAELFDRRGEPAFTSGKGYDAMLACLRAVQRTVEEGVTPRRVAGYDQEDDENPDIVAGRVAMFLGGSWQAAALDGLMKDEDFFRRWGVAPMPTLGGDRHVSATGGWMWAAFTDDEKKIAAGLDWVNSAYVGDRGMAAWCSLGGYLPPRRSTYRRAEYEQDPFTPVFRDHIIRYGRARPSDRKYQDVSHTMQIALSSVASGTTGAAEALDQALGRLVG
ncbi:carbohydrate ABC transporter substrate-binding protein, CUT1 family [Streptomyces sp. WMMB 714]|uniref:extracellular solute-binding protein n=1 Tax=Streptomyces sp. WMMB 714 TaxID=1286822 RepID=UPI0005F7878A|nr:extracellular solute-binding protein [Streptomyces sp. WMMB 714]SCK05660.1 carbohydrate ABC transporter substrate-binding protein, CUT1 family [Streptomyces sp. WMMB 714]